MPTNDETEKIEVQEVFSEEETAVDTSSKETEKLQNEIHSLQDQNLRLRAEYDNFKKRTEREKKELYGVAEANVLRQILPIFDDLERGLEASTSDENVRKGMEMIYNQGRTILENLGVEEIPAKGETFDPELHNAVMHVEDPAEENNTVTEVFQKGYKKDGKVLRHSMVKVAN